MKTTMLLGELVLLIGDARLRTIHPVGPKGGKSTRYQLASKDPTRDPWYDSAWEAIEGREGTLSARGLEDKLVRDHARYLTTKRNTL
jgi:hypothetical protein